MNLLTANDRIGAYPPSFHAAVNTPLPPFLPLKGAIRADVCVVGAGYTGLSAARHLAERGFDVVVLEASRVGSGASGRNGGQVGSGQRLEQDALEAMVGPDDARRLWDMGEEAKALVRDLAGRMGLAFHPGIAHACRTAAEVDHARHMADHLARRYAYDQVQPMDAGQMADLIGTDRYKGGDLDHGAGHIDPLAFALGLARTCPARIHERSRVTRIDGTTVHTEEGHVQADHVILACNGYLGDLEPQVAARVMPINNFIVATEPLDPAPLSRPVAVADTKFVVNYWRLSDDNRLLFGGGESYGYRFPKDIAATVRAPLAEVYPHLRDVRIDYAWGGTLAITMNRMPCFRQVAPNVLSASGYSGHGVAMATLAGRVLAEAVAGQAERFDLLARLPQPRFPGGVTLRAPLLALAMTWYAMRDRLGI
ncbi:NAD(P)/FAD-dependent oxidoreductase [Falsirhodobacter halotolerans]|uniref:NAD(P)/FAD-dependent oxidoreductase n=1 Tax=Falsirhodobacter halotolerans TaxID=1146892 RepID=UPI001FD1C3AE|nr:FAD-binding oxidoreductase [Falsirhodobacter halotolerans]MCJ8140294.1 FAD-binding oxidoreductase [Falsirhodobacter halotolerans]